MSTPTRFIVIDDDLTNNLLCSIVIKKATHVSEVQTFNFPEKGFEYISTQYKENENPTVLFLDINMPSWTGWDFLKNFETLDEKIKKSFHIYMLSSSLDPVDIARAKSNQNVIDYIVKPLNPKIVSEIVKILN
jgi:two-component SAPR family response regulator